jgi:ribosome-associated protein
MARRKPHFQWTVEDGEAPPLGERRDRNEASIERSALQAMVRRLEPLPKGALQRLPLGDELVEAILHLARLGAQSAHRRQVLRVITLLRDVDLEALEARLAGANPDAALERAAERWRERLLEDEDEALHAYLEEHPSADRQQLRSLIRQSHKEGASAKNARTKLFRFLLAGERAGGEE